MPQVSANGLKLEYETQGDPRNPPLLLIMGLGAPLVRWPQAFCQGLVDGGYHLVRFDNRDVGLSEKLSAHRPVPIKRIALRTLLGLKSQAPYTLDEMAEDTVGLLDALG